MGAGALPRVGWEEGSSLPACSLVPTLVLLPLDLHVLKSKHSTQARTHTRAHTHTRKHTHAHPHTPTDYARLETGPETLTCPQEHCSLGMTSWAEGTQRGRAGWDKRVWWRLSQRVSSRASLSLLGLFPQFVKWTVPLGLTYPSPKVQGQTRGTGRRFWRHGSTGGWWEGSREPLGPWSPKQPQ